MFERILLGVDGSEHSTRAVAVAVDLAKHHQGELLILHVRHEGVTALRAAPEPQEAPEHAQQLTDAALDLATKAGVAARTQVCEGLDIARALLEVAAENVCDAIVIGSHGHRALPELLLGGVAHKVVQLAECPVVVVR